MEVVMVGEASPKTVAITPDAGVAARKSYAPAQMEPPVPTDQIAIIAAAREETVTRQGWPPRGARDEKTRVAKTKDHPGVLVAISHRIPLLSVRTGSWLI